MSVTGQPSETVTGQPAGTVTGQPAETGTGQPAETVTGDTAYPTAQRRKQKAKHKAAKEGLAPEPKRKPQIVEQHFDDCGEDFSPLDIGLI